MWLRYFSGKSLSECLRCGKVQVTSSQWKSPWSIKGTTVGLEGRTFSKEVGNCCRYLQDVLYAAAPHGCDSFGAEYS